MLQVNAHAEGTLPMTYRTPSEDAALERLLATDVGMGVVGRYGDDPDQIWELWGSPDDPVIVVVHGGFFRPTIDRTHARPLAAALARAGFAVVLAEYRRRPGDPDASVTDLRTLAQRLTEDGIDPVAWLGHSAGGTLVLLHALLGPTAPRIIALAPVTDLAGTAVARLGDGAVIEWMGGLPGEVAAYERLDPLRLLRAGVRTTSELVILHGADDGTVPPEQTRALPVPTTILPGAHHFDLIDPDSEHFATVLAALRSR